MFTYARWLVPRGRLAIALTGTALITGVAGAAYASIPDSSGVIHGCYSKFGTLRVVDTSNGEACSSLETSLTWNQQGPPGPQGPQGDPGPQGPPGATKGYFYANNDTAVALNQYASNDVAVLRMDPGTYLVTGTTTVWNHMDHAVDVSCGISSDGAPFETTTVGPDARASVTVVSRTPDGVGLALLDCAVFQEANPDVVATEAEMTAVSVDTVTNEP